jgi:hypothetical protein
MSPILSHITALTFNSFILLSISTNFIVTAFKRRQGRKPKRPFVQKQRTRRYNWSCLGVGTSRSGEAIRKGTGEGILCTHV